MAKLLHHLVAPRSAALAFCLLSAGPAWAQDVELRASPKAQGLSVGLGSVLFGQVSYGWALYQFEADRQDGTQSTGVGTGPYVGLSLPVPGHPRLFLEPSFTFAAEHSSASGNLDLTSIVSLDLTYRSGRWSCSIGGSSANRSAPYQGREITLEVAVGFTLGGAYP